MSDSSHEGPPRRHRHDTPRPALVLLLTLLLALAVMAISAAAAGCPTTVTTTLSGESKEGEAITVIEGAGVKDQASLSGFNSGKAGGTLTYSVYSDKECKTLVAKAGEVTVTGGKAPASSEEKLSAGTYYWQASYKGDEGNQAGSSTCGKEVSTVKATTSLSTTLSGESNEGGTITVLEGSGIEDQATLSGTNAGKAGGTLTYGVYSDKECKTLVAKAGEVTVTSGKAPASSEEKLEAGTYYWQAAYSGDSNNGGSTSTCASEVATVKSSTSVFTTLGGEGQSGGELEVQENAAVTDIATIGGVNAVKATGTVTYDVYSDSECKKLAAEAGTVKVSGETAPVSSEEKLSIGTYYWRATYSGDSTNAESTSTCGGETVAVKPSTSLATSLTGEGHSGETISVLEGSGATDQATLSGTNASKAEGTVEYFAYFDSECTDLAAETEPVEVTSGTVPQSSSETLPGGTFYWQAVYSGDPNNAGSISTCGKEITTVKGATSLTTSLSGEGRSGETISVEEGTEVSDQATLSGIDAESATGTVTYDAYSDSECKKLAAEAGTVKVSGESVPTSSQETLAVGTYYWQAKYSGDSLNQGSTSACGKEISTVKGALLTTSLSGEGHSGTDVEVQEGMAVGDTAKLSGKSASKATGTVKYALYSESKCKTLVANAGEVTVSSGKIPNSSTEKLKNGTYYWQASYSGDEHNEGSTTECGKEVAVVKAAPMPRLAEVDFTGNKEVILDHPVGPRGPLPGFVGITGYPRAGENSVEWKSAAVSVGPKNWPVVYVRGGKMEFEARFVPDELTSNLVASKEIESATITAQAKIFGVQMKISSKQLTSSELETQLKTASRMISTGKLESPALPNEAGYENITLEWEWTVKLKNRGEVTEKLASSTHNLYTIYAAPIQAGPIYFTILDIAGQGQVGEPRAHTSTENATITGVWNGFTHVSPPKTELETFARTYEPAMGRIGKGQLMSYWGEGTIRPVGRTLAALRPGAPGINTVTNSLRGLLQRGKGECGTWAEALQAAMGSEGIKSKFMLIVPNLPGASTMLVKNWRFANPPPGLNTFGEVTREAGIAGQAKANPWAFFVGHVITVVENNEEKNARRLFGYGEIYDASYGSVGPVVSVTNENETIQKLGEGLREYKEANIAGFCGVSACQGAMAGAVQMSFQSVRTIPGRLAGSGSYP
jgi:hypothetical protein